MAAGQRENLCRIGDQRPQLASWVLHGHFAGRVVLWGGRWAGPALQHIKDERVSALRVRVQLCGWLLRVQLCGWARGDRDDSSPVACSCAVAADLPRAEPLIQGHLPAQAWDFKGSRDWDWGRGSQDRAGCGRGSPGGTGAWLPRRAGWGRGSPPPRWAWGVATTRDMTGCSSPKKGRFGAWFS